MSKKKTKGSKKSRKIGWNKTDITEVEEHLEDQRREERTGGPVSEKSSESLFFIDNKDSGSQGPIVKATPVVEDSDSEDEYVSDRQKRNEKWKKENKKEAQLVDQERNPKVLNIWGQENVVVADSWIDATVKIPKVKPDSIITGRSELEAVQAPHPGSSYNPDFDHHQDLLRKAHEEEAAKEKEREKLNEKVKMVSVDELKKQSKIWLEEMSEGLNADKLEKSEDEAEQGEVCLTAANVTNTNRKTLRDRRKEKETKDEEYQKTLSKVEKIKTHDLTRLKTLKRQIKEETEISKKRIKLRQTKNIHAMKTRTKNLGKHKYRDPNVVVQLSEDLSATLRELKPEGNLLEDRFKNLQKRNIIETRKKVIPHRKYKVNMVVKRSYKKTDTIRDLAAR